MSLSTILPAAALETIVINLAALFLSGANGDMDVARDAARQMLAAYNPETEDELRFASNLIGFSFHSIIALGQAAATDMSLNQAMRLRGGAISLCRASEKAERRLRDLQKARRENAAPAPAEHTAVPEPVVEKAVALGAETGKVAAVAKAEGLTWSQAYEKRQRDQRTVVSQTRAQDRIAEMVAAELAQHAAARQMAGGPA